MDTFARVKRLEGQHAIVEIDASGGGCGRCDEPGGCRSGILSHLFHKPCSEFAIRNEIGAREGDRVVVQLGHGKLVLWAVFAYLIPLATMLLGAVAGDVAADRFMVRSELWPTAGGMLGLLGGAVLALRMARRNSRASGVRLAWP